LGRLGLFLSNKEAAMFTNDARNRPPGSGPLRGLGAFALAALLALPVAIGGCSDDDNGTGPDTDTTPPNVQSVSPADGATGVPVNTAIQVVFSEPVDPATVTPTTMALQGNPGSLTVSGATVTYTPASFLASTTLHTCTVTTGVKDAAGNALGAAFSWTFMTGSQPVADAGDDLDASIGEPVFLDGSGSVDPDGDALATYAWTQVHGPVVTVLNANTATPAIQNPPAVVSTLGFELVVGTADETSAPDRIDVRILEDKDHQLWVSGTGDDANAGTRASPMATVQAAIDASAAEGLGADVYVAAGTYSGSLTVTDGVSLYGGFDGVEWLRDITTYDTVIQGGRRAIHVDKASNLTINGLTVVATDAAVPGQSSVAIGLSESRAVAITRNRLTAGKGAAGPAGPAGQPGLNGPAGNNGSGATGGQPGIGPAHDGGKGGNGASFLSNGSTGAYGQGPLGGVGGAGGGVGYWGDPGGGGGNGVGGAAGAGGPAFHAVGFGDYFAGDGATGAAGGHGCGGGGGGGGGGAVFWNGGGGGGGGAGGQGGGGGIGGGGGGGSFGILITDASQAVVHDNVITTAGAGNGAMGGKGAPGGVGGPGGQGYAASNAGDGGDGGYGGVGGIGGDGGGGAGGPVFGIVEDAGSASDRTGNSFTIGTPGAGATGPGGAGSAGESGEYKKL
jgi:hypothetical protein